MIRPFLSGDSSQVRALVLDVLEGEGFHYDPAKDSDLDDIEGFYMDDGGTFFVAVDDDAVIGTSALRRIDQDTCEIKRIYVCREYRCKGIGSSLLSEALDAAKHNFCHATLKTDASLDDAIRLYLRNGFVIVKEEKGVVYFEKDLL